MDESRWQQAKKLFEKALELPVADRQSFLDERCGDDAELRSELEELVSSYDSDFLEEPSLERAGRVLAESLFENGKMIGRYRMRKEAGR